MKALLVVISEEENMIEDSTELPLYWEGLTSFLLEHCVCILFEQL